MVFKRGQYASPRTEFKKGDTPWNKGIEQTEEHIRKRIATRRKNGWWKNPEKTKRKISLNAKDNPIYGMKGRRLPEEAKRKVALSKIGIPRSEETKRKLSETRKRLYKEGKIIPPWLRKKRPPFPQEWRKNISLSHKGKKNYMYGKHHTEETKRKISQNKERARKISKALRGRKRPDLAELNRRLKPKQMKGERNPRWLGGISFEPYTSDFNKKLKEEIKKRDNYTCQLCGNYIPKFISQKKRLVVHHINYNKKDNRPENLITLCPPCNASVNSTRGDWTKHFKSKREGGAIILTENIISKVRL